MKFYSCDTLYCTKKKTLCFCDKKKSIFRAQEEIGETKKIFETIEKPFSSTRLEEKEEKLNKRLYKKKWQVEHLEMIKIVRRKFKGGAS